MRRWFFVLMALWACPASGQTMTGTLTAADQSLTYTVGQALSVGISLTGTHTGTMTFQCGINGNWTSAFVTDLATGTAGSTSTTTGAYSWNNGGCLQLRVYATSLASGAVSVVITRGYGLSRTLTPSANRFFAAATADCTAPAYSFTGDPNTGLTSLGADSLSHCAGGVENFRVTTVGTAAVANVLGTLYSVPEASGGFNGFYVADSFANATGRAGWFSPVDGEVTFTDFGLAVNAGVRVRLLVETIAVAKAPTALESNELYTNGADVDGQLLTLPNDPTVGLRYFGGVTATNTSNSFSVAPSAGETLYMGAAPCSTLTAVDKGATVDVAALQGGSGGIWAVMSSTGAWTCTP